MDQMNSHTDNEITIVTEARRQVAAGIAPAGLLERAYRVIERYPHDPADNGIIAAAMDAGILQLCHLEDSDYVDGWSRLKLVHADGREESFDLLVYRQQNPDRVLFDVSLEIAAARLAKALPKNDPRQGEIATLTLARAAVRKTLNRLVGEFRPTTSDDAVAMIHKFGDAWDDHHRLQLFAIAGTPASYAQVPA